MTVLLIIVACLGILVGMLLALILIRVEHGRYNTASEREIRAVEREAEIDNVLPRWHP